MCEECGVEFQPVTWYGPDPRFCGQVCKQRAYRRRKKAAGQTRNVVAADPLVTSRRRLVTVGPGVEVVAWPASLPLCGTCRILDDPHHGARVHRCELVEDHEGHHCDLVTGLRWYGPLGRLAPPIEPVRVLGRSA